MMWSFWWIIRALISILLSLCMRKQDTGLLLYLSQDLGMERSIGSKNIKRCGLTFSMLPFEVGFSRDIDIPFIMYYRKSDGRCGDRLQGVASGVLYDFIADSELADKPILTLLAGSRKQEIKDNLPGMIRAASAFPGYPSLCWQLLGHFSGILCQIYSKRNGTGGDF